MPLTVAGIIGLAVELAAPPVPALAAPLSGSINLADLGGTVAGATFSGIADDDLAGMGHLKTHGLYGD